MVEGEHCDCQGLFIVKNIRLNRLVPGRIATLANQGVDQTLNRSLSGKRTLVTAYAVANLYHKVSCH